jgi:hypothetical protein
MKAFTLLNPSLYVGVWQLAVTSTSIEKSIFRTLVVLKLQRRLYHYIVSEFRHTCKNFERGLLRYTLAKNTVIPKKRVSKTLGVWRHLPFIYFMISTYKRNFSYCVGWPMYAQLLTALFKFLSPFLRNAELAKPVQR